MTKIMAGNCVHYSGRHPFPESRPAVSFLARKDKIPIGLPVFLDKKDQFVKAPVECRPLHRRHMAHIYHSTISNLQNLILYFFRHHPARFPLMVTTLCEYYSLDYLHPKSPFLPRLVESTDVSSQAENPSLSLHLRFLCYHTFVTRLKKQEPQPSKVKLLPSSIRGLRRFITCL